METISQIQFDDITINFMTRNGFIGYSFEFKGKSYGHKTKLKTKKQYEIVGTTATLTINAIKTYESLKNSNESAS